MASSPRRFSLYRTRAVAVTAALAACALTAGWAQIARKTKVSAGPRAVGLIQLASSGHTRLLPIAIMVDGKFFDAGSYKANPVPMALDFGIVYEGFRTGVSQGTFTITQPGQLAHSWIAEGTWLPTGAKPPQTHLKADMPNLEEKDAPPKLQRGSKPSPPGDQPKSAPPAANSEPPKAAPPAAAPAPEAKAEPSAPANIDDPNRPTLRRGKPDPNAHHEAVKTFDDEPAKPTVVKAPATKAGEAKSPSSAQLIPAVSDVGGPEARSYDYEMKPDEEAEYRKKMLDLATAELHRKQKQNAPSSMPSRKTAAVAKPAPVTFDDVHLRVFDLAGANEPILVLSATVPPPANAGDSVLPQQVTLVARTNLALDLHKLFFSITDSKHLDTSPRMELIDAVDADGDGRGELLFRRVSDGGSAYAIYRAAADQLWPLWEPRP